MLAEMTTTLTTYLLRWTDEQADEASRAATAAGVHLSVWLRQAVEEKLGAERKPRRPKRPVLVAPDLTALQGPAAGSVTLPRALFWSAEDASFDLGDPAQRRQMYETVLREARTQKHLTTYLNGVLLVCLWQEIYNKQIRQAWEAQHPVLRALGRAAA
jgi:hypothetical protein